MYPDKQDTERVLRRLGRDRALASTIWQDVALLHNFLSEARGYCFNHGRHKFIPVSEVKRITETFLSKVFSDDALNVSVFLMNVATPVKNSSQDGQLIIKLPPLEKFREFQEQWDRHLAYLEKDIQQESEAIKHWDAVRAKYQTSTRIKHVCIAPLAV